MGNLVRIQFGQPQRWGMFTYMILQLQKSVKYMFQINEHR